MPARSKAAALTAHRHAAPANSTFNLTRIMR